MKKLTLLLVAALVTSSVTGCGCCRRVRNLFNRGAYVGGPVVTSPQVIMPAPAPVVVPSTPYVAPTAAPCCDPCCTPCEPCCDPCSQGYGPTPTSYPVGGYYENGCDTCSGFNGGIGAIPSGVIDPGPVPPGP